MGLIHSPSIVTDSLALYVDAANAKSYPGSGTTCTDLSGNGRTTTLNAGPTYNSQNGGQFVLDGVDDYLSFASPSPMAGTSLFTFEIWINFTTISGNFGSTNKAAMLLAGGTSFGTGQPEMFVLSSDNTSTTPNIINFGRGGGGTTGTCQFNVSSLITNGNWYQIVLVRDSASSQVVYINGKSIGTGTVSTSFTDGQTDIGGLHGNSGYSGFTAGKVANVKIYNRALTSNEVLQNFNALRGRFGV